ncbi:fructose-bisphosphatase class III, partial [Staphylococcus epidermidis]|uniref:fructose-bisphosphatase class III n=1 Tax=Staphylococcus epidermidis TaxID=1282 RepID=UPI0037D9CEBB
MPLHQDPQIQSFQIQPQPLTPPQLLHLFQYHLTTPFHHKQSTQHISTDLLSYLSTRKYSSLFRKPAITTFQPYFIQHKPSHKHHKNPYYYLPQH